MFIILRRLAHKPSDDDRTNIEDEDTQYGDPNHSGKSFEDGVREEIQLLHEAEKSNDTQETEKPEGPHQENEKSSATTFLRRRNMLQSAVRHTQCDDSKIKDVP